MAHYVHHGGVERVYLHLVSAFSVLTFCPLRLGLPWPFSDGGCVYVCVCVYEGTGEWVCVDEV